MLPTVAVILLGGPIKYWWDNNWDLPAHWHYDAWREFLNQRFVDVGGYLVYRPHHAFKGAWTERGQSVNDMALKLADVFINMTPPGVPSEGTDGEVLLASNHGAIIVPAPPPERREDFEAAFQQLLFVLEALNVRRELVAQEKVLDSIGYLPGREWMFSALFAYYASNVMRLHYQAQSGSIAVTDVTAASLQVAGSLVALTSTSTLRLDVDRLLKVEVLDRTSL